MKIKKLGLVVAMSDEQKEIYSTLGVKLKEELYGYIRVTTFKYKDIEIFMADSGIGEISAALATQLLIVKYGAELILNFGVVGSLKPQYKRKQVLLVKEVVHYDFSLLLSDDTMSGVYPFHEKDKNFVFKSDTDILNLVKSIIGDLQEVRIASGDKFINVTDKKNWLVSHFDCDICDMESAGIHLACLNNNVPYIMIKVVSDNADENALESLDEILENGVTFYVDAVKKIIDEIS